MNLTKTLNLTLNSLGVDAASLLDSDNPSKALFKRIRIALKQLHPDAGGNAAEFDKLHKLYETLLTFKKNNSDYEAYIKDGLGFVAKRIKTSSTIDFELDTDISAIDLMHKRIKYAYVNISELVLHFNKLGYCQVQENTSLLCDMIKIPINIIALEPNEKTGKMLESSVRIDKLIPHSYQGRYETYVALEVMRGAIIKINVPGFEKTAEYTIDTSGGFEIIFDENLVRLTIKLQITVM